MLKTIARIGYEEEKEELPLDVTLSLAGYIENCYTQSKSSMQHITERLLKCERQRRGEYDPDKLAKIKETGGSEVFLMLTDIKCRAAESWIKDVMLSAGETPWALEHTKIPDLHPSAKEQIIVELQAEIDAAAQQGEQITPEMIRQRATTAVREMRDRLVKEADRARDAMGAKIEDILQEARWVDTFSDVIYDFVTFPFCVFKGPVLKRKRSMVWGQSWTPEVKEELVWDFERVSPYDAFFSPSSGDIQDGWFIRRHKMTVASLSQLKGVPGYKDEEIDAAINQYKSAGLREVTYGETEREWLAGRRNSMLSNEIITAIEFWGDVHGSALVEWGMDVDENAVYPVTAWKVGSHVISAQINPDPLGKRPYSHACFERVPGSVVGKALPEMMRDTQELCNNSARSLANNMAVSSGPQVEVSVDRLPAGEDVTQMYPWKIWQTTSDRTGGGQPAIRFFQPEMNAEVLLNVLQYFSRIADEVTGVPNYIYGNAQSSGAGRTASGLSMLMDNASKGIKQAILSLDRATNDMLTRLYVKLMIYDPDTAIKGDMKVVPSGIVGALIKDHIQEKRQMFFQTVSNPLDSQLLGPKRRLMMIKELARGLQIDADKFLPTDEEIESMQDQQQGDPAMMAQQLQQSQMMIQQLQQQLDDKTAELELKREEIASRIEEARIRSSAEIESRTHENEVRARTDAEARIRQAEIDRQTKLEVAQIVAESKVVATQHAEETKRISAYHNTSLERDRMNGEPDVESVVQKVVEPIMRKLEEIEGRIEE